MGIRSPFPFQNPAKEKNPFLPSNNRTFTQPTSVRSQHCMYSTLHPNMSTYLVILEERKKHLEPFDAFAAMLCYAVPRYLGSQPSYVHLLLTTGRKADPSGLQGKVKN
jgi:hypothetical protein